VVKNANLVLRGTDGRHGTMDSRSGANNARGRLPSRGIAALLLLTIPVAGFVGCEKAGSMAATSSSSVATSTPKSVADFFPIKVGDKVVRMQLAVRPAEMQRGLMERRDLGPDDGMIFVYDKPQQMSFWMRNTPTALDIGFFRVDGVLEEIYPMYPFDEKTVTSRSDRLHFALETNQGWFAANGVKPGVKIDVKALAAALKARGFDPRKFGLDE
jgi:uncharacterized membrane protein (UPF0127 family)